MHVDRAHIMTSSRLSRLGVVRQIQNCGGVAVFDFSKKGLAIKARGRIVNERSREELLTMKDGLRWVEQLTRKSSTKSRETLVRSRGY